MSILELLLNAYPGPVSGEEMARKLGLSRTGIWKQVRNLTDLGMKIEGRQNSGYRLLTWPDQLHPDIIRYYLQRELVKNITYQSSVGSTNTLAKELAMRGSSHGTLVTADEQTAGRGRRGRNWLSDRGMGAYMTLILRPDIPSHRVPMLTIVTGIAVVQAAHQLGLDGAWLKWPNDVWVGRRKLAGILSELSGELEQIDFVVVGIGVNANQAEFPPELEATATSFRNETGEPVNRAKLTARIMDNLALLLPLLAAPDITPVISLYLQYDRLIGKPVQVHAPAEDFVGVAQELTSDGALIVKLADGTERVVLAGDVSLRPDR